MTELLTAAEMRAVEQAAFDAGAATGEELMERAGEGVVAEVLRWRPDLARRGGRAVALCGPGNNGGDGLVVARLLRARGWDVDVFLFGASEKLPPDAARNLDRWLASGDARPSTEFEGVAHGELLIDALFGAGLGRDLEGEAARLVGLFTPETVAVDGPSGLDLDDGRSRGPVAPVGLTVTFHRAKRGHHLGDGPTLCGRLAIADISLDASTHGPVRLARPDMARVFKRAAAHKYSHGHMLALSPGAGIGGAARLAARGGLRVGAGLVTVCAPGDAQLENAARLDAIMLRRVDDAADLAAMLEDPRLNAVVLGPGFEPEPLVRDLALTAIEAGRRVVLDAGAIAGFAADEAAFSRAIAASEPDRVVYTPHQGEFAKLFPDFSAEADRGDAVRAVEAAARIANATILLKGRATVIAAPGRSTVISSAAYERAAPQLATAGAGDVLTGMIGGLMARGFDGPDAAETASWLHVEAARQVGPGLIAEDIPEALPTVLSALAAAVHRR